MRQTFLLIILVAALLVTGYFLYLFMSAGPQIETSETNGIASEKLAEYRKVKTLKLDLGIFDDAFFKSLVSFSEGLGVATATPIGVKPGRANPFVPF